MYYMYVLRSKVNKTFYVGSTNNLRIRFAEHNNGNSIFTKKFMPWTLVYYEAYPTYKLAYIRERALKKRAKGWQELLKRLEIEM
jgi:putative endonuclease